MRNRPIDINAALADEPWLRPYLRDAGESIDAARRRFNADQRALLRRMLADGVELHNRFVKADGMLTTSVDEQGVRR